MSGRTTTLSEHASKQLLAEFGIEGAREEITADATMAAEAATRIGFPVVVKLSGSGIRHKTERNLLRLSLRDAGDVERAAAELLALARPEDGEVSLLVAEMVEGHLELIAGLIRDPQLGPCVMLGLGGILAEALGDVAFASVPLSQSEAEGLGDRLAASYLLDQPLRGAPPVDRKALARILNGLSELAQRRPEVQSVDINPLIVHDGVPVPVDALVELATESDAGVPALRRSDAETRRRFEPLFSPRGIILAGVSTHPAKFGFTALHNLMRFDYPGEIFPIGRERGEVLGREILSSVHDVPEGAADLVFVCTPAKGNLDLLRAAAEKGARAAFVVSGGYSDAGEEGRRQEAKLVELAEELGMLVAGPNGQGLISTPASMCAQIVSPYPGRGRIGIVSQSGNLTSTFLNYSVESGVGVSRAISCGNSAQTNVADYLDYLRTDPETSVALVYLEGLGDGGHFVEALRAFTLAKPVVIVKGGTEDAGALAAASHTGSLASDGRVFDGVCAQLGALRTNDPEQAFEWAATFATQPLPAGRRTIVLTTAGGQGVLAADACGRLGLDLMALPKEIQEAVDARVPSRWSRRNPVDLAGGESRDTIPELVELICSHSEVDALLHLGVGIQAASAAVLESGRFYPDHGLERIVAYHQRQDRRYAAADRQVSEQTGKPVLTATELVHTDRAYGNSGPLGVKEEGRYCHASAERALAALRALVHYAEFREGVG